MQQTIAEGDEQRRGEGQDAEGVGAHDGGSQSDAVGGALPWRAKEQTAKEGEDRAGEPRDNQQEECGRTRVLEAARLADEPAVGEPAGRYLGDVERGEQA